MSAQIIPFPVRERGPSASDEVFHEMSEYMRVGLLALVNDHWSFISKIDARSCGRISDHLWSLRDVQTLSAKQIKTVTNDLYLFLVIRERTTERAKEAICHGIVKVGAPSDFLNIEP
jgi:hypothetical protein